MTTRGQIWSRRRVFEIVEEAAPGDRVSNLFDWFLIVLIVLNISAVVLETVPSINRVYGAAFYAFEVVSVIIFTVEYLLRLWAAPEHPALKRLGPGKARLHHVFSFSALIDLAAILPFYLAAIFGADLRVLRVLRLLRFLKLVRYSPALMTMHRVIVDESRALMGALFIMLGLLIIASTAMYYAERHVQPEVFGSIPAAMWWGLATLTTVGYGDMIPVTLLGKVIGGVVMLLGLGMFALPIGILATGFTQEVRRREFVVTRSMVGRLELLEDLPPPEITRLTRQMRAIRHDVGSVIIRRGEPVESLYFLAVGDVDVEQNDHIFSLSDGGVFGENALLHSQQNEVMAIATSQSLVMALDLRDLNALIDRHPEIGDKLSQLALERARPIL